MLKQKKQYKSLALGLAGAALAACLAGAAFLLAPSQRIDLDVNPSIELTTNRLDKVTSIRAVNEDAKKLLEGYAPADRDLDDVVEDLIERMMKQGYLGEGRPNEVLITVDDSAASREMLERVNSAVAAALEKSKLQGAVHGQEVDLDEFEQRAAELGVSAGRMAVIDRLVQGDAALQPADLAGTRVSDLLEYARQKGVSLDFLENRLDDLQDRFRDDPALEALEDGLDAAQDASEPEDDLDEPEDDLDEPEDDPDEPEDDLDEPEDDLDEPEDDLDEPEDDLDDAAAPAWAGGQSRADGEGEEEND